MVGEWNFQSDFKIQRTHCAAPEALEHSALERRRRCHCAAATFRTVVGMVLLEVLKKKFVLQLCQLCSLS